MIQHVAIPVPAGLLAPCEGFYRILGFASVPPPPSLADRARWLARRDQQVHLQVGDDGPARGHFALHLADYAGTLLALREAGHEVEPRAEHWGAPRAFATDPAGNVVELMASPPPASAS